MNLGRAILNWSALAIVIVVPIAAAAMSPLLAWREPIYIAAGFAGVIAMALLLLQPLLAGGYLPRLHALRGRRLHRIVGALLVVAILAHVLGLWLTSPPDVIDALLFASPTPFSFWGVIAMWAVFATGALALVRNRLNPRSWRRIHAGLAIVIVLGSVVHAILIQGAMEPITKAVLCMAVIAATVIMLFRKKIFVRG